MNAITRPFVWLFTVPEGPRTPRDVILWWEKRRVPYNLIVGIHGVASLVLFLYFITHADVLAPGEDAVEPIALMAAPFLVNIAYTAGWILELATGSPTRLGGRKTGPLLLALGLGFSLLVVWLPSVFWGIQWLVQILGR